MSARGASRRRPAIWALALAAAVTLLSSAAPAPAPASTLVHYTKSGGFAGVRIAVTITTGGTVQVVDKRAGDKRSRLTSTRLRGLRRLLSEAKVATLKRSYGARGVISDGFVETVRFAGRTITVETGGSPPERLRRLLSRLASFTAG